MMLKKQLASSLQLERIKRFLLFCNLFLKVSCCLWLETPMVPQPSSHLILEKALLASFSMLFLSSEGVPDEEGRFRKAWVHEKVSPMFGLVLGETTSHRIAQAKY